MIYGDAACADNVNMGGVYAVKTTTTVPVGVWYHLAIVYNSIAGSVNMYLNGTLAGNSTGVSVPVVNRTSGNWFAYAGNHQLDEIKVYNKSLSQAQVMLDMTHIGIPSGVC
jgi:hypothetical protein